MKTNKISYLLTAITLCACCRYGFSQKKYRVELSEQSITFYCGIVNKLLLEVLDVSDQKRTLSFHASADGMLIGYDASGRLEVLPQKEQSVIRVYGGWQGSYFLAGQVRCTCKMPPLNDAAFQAAYPNPAKEISTPVQFNPDPSKVKRDRNIILNQSGAVVTSLAQNIPTRIQVKIWEQAEAGLLKRILDNISMKSEDAEIEKVTDFIFEVKPKPSASRCRLIVLLNNQTIHTADLLVK